MTNVAGASSEAWRSFSHEMLEREYSPSSCVPDGDLTPYLAAYADRSAAARAHAAEAVDVELTEVRYGPATSQTIDVAFAATGDTTPLLAYIHGGYWRQLSKRESFFAATHSIAQGVAYAAIDYTLAPHASLDEIVEECRVAVTKLHASADQLNIDPDRIFVAGSSAGAHLSAMTALDASSDVRLAGCCLVSGIFDLEPLIETYINDPLGLDVVAARRNSPLFGDLEGFPRTVVAVGSEETAEFKRQSIAMGGALREAGVEIEHLEIAGRNHFDVILDLCDDQTPLGAAMLGLVNQPV